MDSNSPTIPDAEQAVPSATTEASEMPTAHGTAPLTDDGILVHGKEPQGGLGFAEWIALVHDEVSSRPNDRTNLGHSSALNVLPESRASDDDRSLASFVPPISSNCLTGVANGTLDDWTTGEKHLLNHYLQVVSRLLVVVPDNDNPYLQELIPMAFESTTVRHALVALAACHLQRVYPDFQRNFLFHRSMTLQGLKGDLDEPDGASYSLAATLLLCLLEVRSPNL